MSPINKVILGLVLSIALLAGLFFYFKKEPVIKEEVTITTASTKKKHTKRVIPQAGLPPIVEEIEEDEKLDSFVKASLSVPAKKHYLFGATVSYDQKINYHIVVGKAVTDDCYAVAKASTDFQLSKVEAGALCTF